MSRRDRQARAGGRPAPAAAQRPAPGDPAPRPAPRDPAPIPAATEPRGDDASLGARLRAATIPAGALLPLRIFFGVTFLYAGIDKLIDPAFFDASNPGSILAQMTEFARVSPLAPLVRLGEPFALLIGLAIAFAEIGIGVGALTGLAFRVAAAGGAALSFLFWLTASWSTHPYYYGPDLPYALGWVTLALAGHGGLLVPRWVRTMGDAPAATSRGARRTTRGDGWTPRPARGWDATEPGAMSRRTLIQLGVLAGAALVVGTASTPLRLLRGGDAAASGPTGLGGTPTPPAGTAPSPAATAHPTAGATPRPTTAPSGVAVAKVSDLANAGAVAFTVPMDAPAPLPAGDPGVIVKLANGSLVAYDAVCTHQGCTVEWDQADAVLVCPCHGAAFDPANNAQVLQGPARQPLAALPLAINAATGVISLKA